MSLELSDELRALLGLQLVPGLGPLRTKAILEQFGSARAVTQASAAQLAETPGIGPKTANDIITWLREGDLDTELKLIEKFQVGLRVRGQEGYPLTLADIHDPPSLLYVRGTLEPSDAKAVAVVGSRHPTEYGKRTATRLGMELARAGYIVVSGLARGIDAAAHRGALQAGGRTLAILAGGLSRIYPPEHRGLAEEVEKSGALITESSMQQEPLAGLFPARNRIISGLSKAVVLVEAGEKSEALITARLALDQSRHVLAVPGPIDSEMSGGTNQLIRTGAALCRGVEDILEEVEGVSARVLAEKTTPSAPAPTPPKLEADQAHVWELLGAGPQHLDEIVRQLNLGVGPLSGLLLTLEMKKLIRRLPGNRYERC